MQSAWHCSKMHRPQPRVRDWKGAVGGLFFAHAKKRRYPCKARPCSSVYCCPNGYRRAVPNRTPYQVTGIAANDTARERPEKKKTKGVALLYAHYAQGANPQKGYMCRKYPFCGHLPFQLSHPHSLCYTITSLHSRQAIYFSLVSSLSISIGFSSSTSGSTWGAFSMSSAKGLAPR